MYTCVRHAGMNLVVTCNGEALKTKMNDSAKTQYIFNMLLY